MRALHIISSVAAREGGPAYAIRGMTSALAARGVEVTVATTDADGNGRLSVPLDVPVMEGDVEFRYFARTLPGKYKFSLPLASWLRENVRRFDVVTVHGLWEWASVPGCRIARHHRVPYVVRPLGMLDAWSLSVRRWKKAPYYRAIERSHLKHAAAIHATAPAEAAGIAALGFGDRTRVIPLGVSAPAALPRRRAAVASGPVRLVFLSRVHPKKGLPLLLEAMASAVAAGADLELDVVGDGDPAYVSMMRDRGAMLGGRVRFLGHLDGDAKWAALSASDVFVLPSSQENFGIAVAEAMAAGLPVVISDQVAIAPDVLDAGAGLVVPLDTGRLTAALLELSGDADQRTRMGARARALAEGSYSWAECARRLEELYHDLTAARVHPPLLATGRR